MFSETSQNSLHYYKASLWKCCLKLQNEVPIWKQLWVQVFLQGINKTKNPIRCWFLCVPSSLWVLISPVFWCNFICWNSLLQANIFKIYTWVLRTLDCNCLRARYMLFNLPQELKRYVGKHISGKELLQLWCKNWMSATHLCWLEKFIKHFRQGRMCMDSKFEILQDQIHSK